MLTVGAVIPTRKISCAAIGLRGETKRRTQRRTDKMDGSHGPLLEAGKSINREIPPGPVGRQRPSSRLTIVTGTHTGAPYRVLAGESCGGVAMAARLIRPLYARLDVRTGKAEMARPQAASNNGGAARVVPDQKNGAGVRGSAPVPPPATNLDNGGSIRVQRDGTTAAEERREPSLSPALKNSDGGSIKVARDDKIVTEERREPSLSPPLKSADSGSIKVARNEKPIAELRREPSLSPPLKSPDDSAMKALRDDKAGIDERRDAPLSPPPKTSEDGPAEDPSPREDRDRRPGTRTPISSCARIIRASGQPPGA